MNLKLSKPLAFFDLETTGINVGKDKIVEICILKVQKDGSEECKTWRVNPGIPIPKESSDVHGITDDMVKDCPTFAELAVEIYNFLKDADLSGYNSNRFDLPLLAEEFLRADIDFDMKNRRSIDVQSVFFKMEPRTLTAAYRFYCNKELVNAHSAEADTVATPSNVTTTAQPSAFPPPPPASNHSEPPAVKKSKADMFDDLFEDEPGNKEEAPF